MIYLFASVKLWETQSCGWWDSVSTSSRLFAGCQGVRPLPEGRRTWTLEWDVVVGDALIGEVGRGSGNEFQIQLLLVRHQPVHAPLSHEESVLGVIFELHRPQFHQLLLY